jgi:transposase
MNSNSSLSIRFVRIGALPIIQQLIEQLGLEKIFSQYVKRDPRDKMPVSKVLSIALLNIILERFPLYKMGDWGARHGLIPNNMIDCFNDDRIGRALDRLFDADRAALIGAVTLKAINTFRIDTRQIHNDSTSISLFGKYDKYEELVKPIKAAKPACSKNSKDHRPDLKQIVFSLTVAGDGAVPLYFKVWDGNTTDDTTHLSNWMSLRSLLGKADFIYVADCKLCVKETMQFIATEGGIFVTVMPETRKEIERFREWIQINNPDWNQALCLPNMHDKDGPPRMFWTYDSPFLSADGFRIIWVKSSAKQNEDEQRRAQKIECVREALTLLSAKVHRNHDRLAAAVSGIIKKYTCEKYFDFQITKQVEEEFKQQQRGRPTAATTFRKVEKPFYQLSWCENAERIQYDTRYDGIFPLITNYNSSAKEILKIYKYQPYLEKRHEQLKSVYNVAPVFLRNPQRIESLLLLYFLGMLISALIERRVRQEMKSRELESIPIYPEARPCKSPTTDKLINLFSDVRLQYICKGGEIVQIVPDEFSKIQKLILDLIGLKPEKFFAPE